MPSASSRSFIYFGLAASLLATVACGGDDSDGGTTASGTGGAAGMGSGGGGGVQQAAHRGAVSVTTIDNDVVTLSSVYAGFLDNDTTATPACPVETVDGCSVVINCPPGSTTIPPTLSAGVITISGGSQSPVTLTLGNDGRYSGDQDSSAIMFSGGETLTVNAPGDVVPSFQQASTAPAPVVVSAPAIATSMPLTVDINSDLDVRWQAQEGSVQVLINGQDVVGPNGAQSVASCSFDGPGGVGTIPSAVLQRFADQVNTQLTVQIERVEQVILDEDWDIVWTLKAGGVNPSGGWASGEITLQ